MSFDAARAIFKQIDANQDGGIDQGEFNQWASGAGAGAGAGFGGASSYESSSYSSGGYGAGAGAGFGGASSYESSSSYGAGAGFGGASSYESSASFGSGGYGASAGAGFGGASSYESSSYSSGGYGAGAADSASFSSQTAVQRYPTDAQGLFIDNNPQIIRRAATGGVQTYQQNIKVRFLQPPPLPPPGVSHRLLFIRFIQSNQ